MNNFNKIKSMTLDEMAEWYKDHVPCGNCDLFDYCIKSKHTICNKVIKQWLQQESEDNNG